jgi:hypothetical protein
VRPEHFEVESHRQMSAQKKRGGAAGPDLLLAWLAQGPYGLRKVMNIMAALKESMQKQGRAKVSHTVRPTHGQKAQCVSGVQIGRQARPLQRAAR